MVESEIKKRQNKSKNKPDEIQKALYHIYSQKCLYFFRRILETKIKRDFQIRFGFIENFDFMNLKFFETNLRLMRNVVSWLNKNN